jgi:tetratricopeptide (TPR) repeat protein
MALLAWLTMCAASQAGQATPVTFNEDVAPILYEHCAVCHRPGQSAPFDLLTYQDAKKHDKQIAIVTSSRFMPPWLPERGVTAFDGERGLSELQIDLLNRWYREGSPEGSPEELPPLPEWSASWYLGQPDLVIQSEESYTLPGDGLDVFRNIIIPIPIDRRRYVRTIDLRPGNLRVVHHAVMRVDRSRSSRLLDARDEEPGYEGMEWGEAQPPEGHFLGWTPGKVPYAGSDELAWVLEPGSDLVVQLHMVPTGKPELIRPKVGLYFAEGPPTRLMDTVVLDVKKIDIPAGKKDYVVEMSCELPVSVDIVSIYPHAHYLGKEMLGWADLPDGTKKWLIRIPDWDFNWQDQYRYSEPIHLPAGSTLALRYTYDNSADNVRNPNFPPKRVVSGNRSTDEMGSMSFEVVVESDEDRGKLKESLLRQDLARWPNYWVAHGLLGSLLLERDEPREALRYLQRAVRIKPDYAVGFNNLGAAMSKLGLQQPATAAFLRALALRPHYADAHYNLGHYRQALDVRSYDPDFHNNLGVALAMTDRLEEATVHFRRVLELQPDSAEAHGNLGNTMVEQDRYAEAIELYRRGLEIRPDSPDLKANLSMTLQVLGEVETRIGDLERSVQAGRSDAHLLGELAELYASAGRYDDAITTVRKAIELASKARAESLAATLHRRLGAFQRFTRE